MEPVVSPRERQVIDVLAALPGEPDFPTLAEAVEAKLNLTSTNTAAILDKLRKKGVVDRRGTRRKYTYFVQTPAPLAASVVAPKPAVAPKSVAAPKPAAVPKSGAAPKPVAPKKEVPMKPATQAPAPVVTAPPQAPEPAYDMNDPASVRMLIEALLDRIEVLNTEVVELRAEKAKLENRKQMSYLTPNLADRLQNVGFNVGAAV